MEVYGQGLARHQLALPALESSVILRSRLDSTYFAGTVCHQSAQWLRAGVMNTEAVFILSFGGVTIIGAINFLMCGIRGALHAGSRKYMHSSLFAIFLCHLQKNRFLQPRRHIGVGDEHR